MAMTETLKAQVHDPVHLVSYSFERDGENLWVYTWLENGGHLPEHFHPSLEEHWEVLEGRAQVKLAGEWRELTPDDGPLVVLAGVRHELGNESGAEVRLRTEVKPAGEARGVPRRERARRARGDLQQPQHADELARRGLDRGLRPAPPRRDRDVLAAALDPEAGHAAVGSLRAPELATP